MTTKNIAGIFQTDDGNRKVNLQTARLCAALTKPWQCPPEGVEAETQLPQPYTSIGARGTSGLSALITASLFPYGVPWFAQEVKPHIAHSNLDPAKVQEAETRLAIEDVILQALLETDHDRALQAGRQTSSFRAAKLKAALQFLITGHSLERLNKDYSITVFPRKDWVCRRRQSGDVRYWITREGVIKSDVGEEAWAKAGLSNDKAEPGMTCDERDLYTHIEWNPDSKKWVIEQELNGHVINTTQEEVCPYWDTPYDLPPGGHYGHGFVEDSLGDLRTVNELTLRTIEGAGQAAKMVPCIDRGSEVQEEDLTKPNGMPIRCRVENGVVMDVGFLKLDKLADFAFVNEIVREIKGDLGKSMMLDTDAVRQSERTTAFEVQEVTIRAIENRLGGMYTVIGDYQQKPFLRRLMWQARADRILVPPPPGTVDVQILTGIAALTHARRAKDLIDWVNVVSAMGPEAVEWVDIGMVAKVLARYKHIDEPGVVKSNERVAQERAAAIQAQAAVDANKQVASSVGAMVEQAHAAQLAKK